MSHLKELLDQEAYRIDADPQALESTLRRRDRKRRNQRIAAGVVGIAVFVAAVWIVTSVGSLDRSETSVVPGGGETGPAETGPSETGATYAGPSYTLGPVTKEDIALGESFMQAWVEGDGEAAAAMFSPEGTIDGFRPAILPALHDWFRAGGWTFEAFEGGGCGVHGWGDKRGVVGCGFTFENDLTRALDMQPVPKELSFAIEAGRIETAWFGGGGDCCHNMFGSPDPLRQELTGVGRDLFGAPWDMFIEWLSTSHPEDFGRMYDRDYGYPVPGYPILNPASIELWQRYTDEFVASPQALRRSFTEWMARQSLEVQAGRTCMTATDEFWAKVGADHLRGSAFDSAMAEVSADTLAALRALPQETEADRATMDEFAPLAERWIEFFRKQAAGKGAPGDDSFFQRRDLEISMDTLIPGCLIQGLPG